MARNVTRQASPSITFYVMELRRVDDHRRGQRRCHVIPMCRSISRKPRRTTMMIPSLFLRRALQADTIFSGAGAVIFSLGAGELAPLFNLPEVLLRETGLFLIAYAALVGWMSTR